MVDTFINIRELVPQLLKYKEDNPNKKIAFCFSGGGARRTQFAANSLPLQDVASIR